MTQTNRMQRTEYLSFEKQKKNKKNKNKITTMLTATNTNTIAPQQHFENIKNSLNINNGNNNATKNHHQNSTLHLCLSLWLLIKLSSHYHPYLYTTIASSKLSERVNSFVYILF